MTCSGGTLFSRAHMRAVLYEKAFLRAARNQLPQFYPNRVLTSFL